jgi:hypothetical protein
MFLINTLANKLNILIQEGKFFEAFEVYKELGVVLETYKYSC